MITPNSERIHIGIFGYRNSGKSSFLNTITGQNTSIVSEHKGTTTDPIYKPMEIHGLGSVVFIDTAGIDDIGELGKLRISKTDSILKKCDIFIYFLSEEDDLKYLKKINRQKKPILFVVSKGDTEEHKKILKKHKALNPFVFTSGDKGKKDEFLKILLDCFEKNKDRTITENLVKSNDLVLLVMPQDAQAPKGRLILPQVQTIRELLDKKVKILVCDLDTIEDILNDLKKSPDLIITDSQYFKEVFDKKPKDSKITSFSVLFSAYKGDIEYFRESVKILDNHEKINKILIAEACTHPPDSEDIGTVKIPNLLKKRLNREIEFEFKRGDDFSDIENYDLIIQCGSCMFNRTHTISRVEKAKQLNIPMTNYGIVIAYLKGILDKVLIP
ncbi:[FeFe] hydrogenase H-cluster maturation GTPase HydF [uncultured Parvimonas sp.]|uniref:[FeFe] hydrogenase H-cluster maturation GTPase HydF n=1 Tax=uncultured Parvimonas sp. TaxID=747372 RepID=UPI002595E379|nr:[FeFe] hydrogenase H-cluster maturation GTPase HydF [uncultured Parvimonas sp.]